MWRDDPGSLTYASAAMEIGLTVTPNTDTTLGDRHDVAERGTVAA